LLITLTLSGWFNHRIQAGGEICALLGTEF
jgi:hypothetical protein